MTRQLDFSRFLATPELPELGPGPRKGVQTQAQLDAALDISLQQSQTSVERLQLIRALVLLWHDHLASAHELAQTIDSQDGAFVHGIMHRREPDYSNAAYWFRRVGPHPVFSEIAKRAKELPGSKSNASLYHQLVKESAWDPFGFIDACKDAATNPAADADQRYLREVQRIETESLLDWLGQQR